MSYEWAHYGSIQLKPGTALQEVLNLFPCEQNTEPQLPLHSEGEVSFANGDVWISLEGGLLEYRAGGYSWALDEQVTQFLQSLADNLAAKGWIDYEVEDHEVAFGPTELARAQARVARARSGLQMAEAALANAEEELQRMGGAEA